VRRNVTCDTCDGSGQVSDWYRPSPDRGWRNRIIDCPKCLGMGKHPEPPPSRGLLRVHSFKADKMSVDEILDRMGVPYGSEEGTDSGAVGTDQ